ncbi:SHOCT domain-containing protein [Flavobacteriaceae bacterium]|nr:SHOCT domain-containing protein [Flavobacteriaceae bacterium]
MSFCSECGTELGNLSSCSKCGTPNKTLKETISINNSNDEVSTSVNDTKQISPTAGELKKQLSQPKSRKYSGHNDFDLSPLADEIETFFSNQKFGWLGEAKPSIVVSKQKESVMIRCYTAKTIVRTWGNSKETAINVIVENNNGIIEFNCGFTGNKAVLSASSIGGAILTGGGSLVGNAASAIKDGKLVNSTMQFIDDMMKNQFQNNSSSSTIVQPENDVLDQIRKLAELKNDGILTEEEFNIKKQELLKKI